MVFIAATPFVAQAGEVLIFVSDARAKSCLLPDDNVIEQNLLTSQETITALDNYFNGNGDPNHDYGAAINHAQIKFCSAKEEKVVLSTIIQKFDAPKISKPLLEMATNYYRSKIIRKIIEEKIHSSTSSPQFKTN